MTTIGRTMIRQRSVNMIGAGGNKTSAEATAWQAAVIANGGTVSAGRLAIVNTFIKAEKSAGTWQLTDDYWPLWAENAAQALTSLKQRRLSTAVAAPVFTVDRDYAFNGTTQYLTTGFASSAHAVAMTGTNLRLAVYERTNVGSGTLAAGALSGTNIGIRITPRSASNFIQGYLNCPTVSLGAATVTDSRGYAAVSRTPSDVYEGFKNGISTGTGVPGANTTALFGAVLFIGAYGNSGVAAGFRACSIGFAAIGASLTPAQELAQYNNVQNWALAIGAVTDDADAQAWMDAVVTNGGTVSAARLKIAADFIKAEKAAGTWALTDDYWGLWAENAPQALTSLKQRRLCTAVAAPIFSVDRGYTFNGTSNYIATGFLPATHSTTMTGTNLRIAAYERIEVSANTYMAGTLDAATTNLSIRPRSGGSCFGNVNAATVTYTLSPATSLGFLAVSRNGAGAAESFAYKNGVALTQASATTFGAALPTREIYIGCYNNAGVAATFRTTQGSFVAVGASLSPAQEAAQYANVQAWATAVGANV